MLEYVALGRMTFAAAIDAKHARHVAIMRMILLRRVSPQDYLFGELH